MRGLAVVDGDLVLFGNSYLTLDGPARVKQDLTFALNDPYGVDPYHPRWGSVLDRFIGLPLTTSVQKQVTDEVSRVLSNYIAVQTDQVNRAVTYGLLSTFDSSDVVQQVNSINVQINADSIQVTVSLTTLSGTNVSVSRTVV